MIINYGKGEKMNKLFTKDILQLSQLIRNREVSPVEVVQQLLDRIDEVDPLLNSYITINRESVLDDAKRKEKDIQSGNYRGRLHGIPIGIKDNIYTKQLKTTMGSQIFKNFIPKEDAFVVKTLKKSGAIIIGKHNTHQFAYGPTGDRSHVGPVRNPHNTAKMSGGSSGGSGAAVAACLCYGALGTDTGGSIRIPASFCGIVGMKPTFGTVSNRGVYPLSWNLDHVGPMTRTITDNALLLNNIVAYDAKDPKSIRRKKEDFTRFIGKDIKGKKIGVPRNTFYYKEVEGEIIEAVESVIELLEKEGAIVQQVDLPNLKRFIEAQRVIIRSDAYAVHQSNLQKHPNLWDDEVKERILTGLEPKGFEYARALQIREFAKEEFHQVLENFDVIVTPTMSIMPPNVGERYTSAEATEEQHIRWTITKLTAPTNFNGLPSLSVPCGFSREGLPIGIQFIGREFSEAKLYQFGFIVEKLLSLKTAKIDIH